MKAVFTIKGENKGPVRSEYEYEIPIADAREMLEDLCESPMIKKIRYLIDYVGMSWEVDIFSGDNEGLCVAEIELEDGN